MIRRPLVVAVGAVAVLAMLAACTSSTSGNGGTRSATASVVSPSSTPPDTITETETVTTTPSATPSSSPSSSSSSSTSTPTPSTTPPPSSAPPRGGCTAAQLKYAAVRGGASQGVEYAGVVFTNMSSTACTLRGYPSAQLRRAGQALGRAATHGDGTVTTVRLRPGGSVQVQLSAITTCQSALSDHVRITAPGVTVSHDVGVQLRACRLAVGPVESS